MPPSVSAQLFFLLQSAFEAQLVLHTVALASQAYDPHDVVAPALHVPLMHVAAAMRLPLLPSQAAAAQMVPFG